MGKVPHYSKASLNPWGPQTMCVTGSSVTEVRQRRESLRRKTLPIIVPWCPGLRIRDPCPSGDMGELRVSTEPMSGIAEALWGDYPKVGM